MHCMIGTAMIVGVVSIGLAVLGSAPTNDELSAQSRAGTRATAVNAGYCPEGTYSKRGTRWAQDLKNCSAANAPRGSGAGQRR
jgi:hypothetical protein